MSLGTAERRDDRRPARCFKSDCQMLPSFPRPRARASGMAVSGWPCGRQCRGAQHEARSLYEACRAVLQEVRMGRHLLSHSVNP